LLESPEHDKRAPRSRWPLFLLRLLAFIILVAVFGRSAVDGVVGAVFKNAAEPLDKELPVTVTAFRSGSTIVSELGGRGAGLNCSLPWGIDVIFTPRPDFQASDSGSTRDDPAGSVPVRQRFRQACVFHDLCYRHGLATYGYSQNDCDELLQEQAFRTCIWASRGERRLSACQLDAKKVTAGVKLMGWYDAYRDWGESTYFEFDPNPYRSPRFYATRAVDHPLKASAATPSAEPDQVLLRFENLSGTARLSCLNCADRRDKLDEAIALPTGRQYAAPHLLVDREGRSLFTWLARQAVDTSESCIVVASPGTLLTDTRPDGPGCYDKANRKLGLGQVDLLSSAVQPLLLPEPSAASADLPSVVASGLTRQNGPLEICISRDMRAGQPHEAANRKNGNCHKLLDPAGDPVLPGFRWLGAYQNFPIVRGSRHIYLARSVVTERDNEPAETIRLMDFDVAPQQMPADAPAASPAPELHNVKSFDIADDFDPMLPLTMDPADSRLISAKVVGSWWSRKLERTDDQLALYEINLVADNPQPVDLSVESAPGGGPLHLHETWARRPILVTETVADGQAKTELILSRSSTELVETDRPKAAGTRNVDHVWFEFAVLERPVAPADPPARFRLDRALACTVTYTVLRPDRDRIHPCQRVTKDVSSDRATPATYLQGAQLLAGRFGAGSELALVDRCMAARPPILLRPVGIGAPVDEPSEVASSTLRRLVECRPFGRAERLAQPL
jgi:hypothetical protein